MDTTPLTLDQILAQTRTALASVSDAPALEARYLLEHLLDVPTSYLITHGTERIAPAQAQALDRLLDRRLTGEPLAYVLGTIGFWDMQLTVDSRVLVPRADTETLVEAVLQRLPASPLSIADLGTGSGAIALALARERPAWQVVATDASSEALACARDNARRLELSRVEFLVGDWYQALAGRRFDALVCNPPYIDPGDAHLEAPALRHEPQAALVAADHGVADLATIVASTHRHLHTNGLLALEHGYDQGDIVRRLLANHHFTAIETVHDLGGQPRTTLGFMQD